MFFLLDFWLPSWRSYQRYGLRPEFKEMWALMKGLTESGETLLLGWWRFRRKNCRAPLPPKKVTNADKQGLALCNMKVYHGFGEELFVTRFCLQIWGSDFFQGGWICARIGGVFARLSMRVLNILSRWHIRYNYTLQKSYLSYRSFLGICSPKSTHTVNGRNPAYQLRLVVYPILCVWDFWTINSRIQRNSSQKIP